jgi:hypothetical protein
MRALIFFLLAAVVIVAIRKALTWSRHRTQQRHLQLIELTQKKGWTLEHADAGSLDYRIRGSTDGINWRLLTESEAGADPSTSTRWSTESVRYPDLVGMIRTRKGYDLLQSMWGRAASGLLNVMTTATGLPAVQHSQLLNDGQQLPARSSDVAENYVAMVRTESGLDRVLSPEVEAALAAWKEVPEAERDTLSVDIGQTNLRVYCRYILAPEHIEKMINLGVAVAKAVRQQ